MQRTRFAPRLESLEGRVALSSTTLLASTGPVPMEKIVPKITDPTAPPLDPTAPVDVPTQNPPAPQPVQPTGPGYVGPF